MSDFSGLPLVIEPSDLLARLDARELILVDLTSSARYAEGHIPGARFVDPKRTQLGQPPGAGALHRPVLMDRHRDLVRHVLAIDCSCGQLPARHPVPPC